MIASLARAAWMVAGHWRWFVRVGVAVALLQLIAPAPPRAVLEPPQTVQTQDAQLCVHTRLMEEVDEWKIQRTLQIVREMGAPTIVEFFPWAYIEPGEDDYHWAAVDRIVRHAQNQGIRIIARLGLVPAWARPNEDERPTTLNELPVESFPDFAEFVARFAERYAGQIDHLIIWNEPNLSFEWGYRPVDPAAYIDLLRVVYEAAHRANPGVTILSAPLAPTLEPAGSPNGMSDLLYFEAMYEAGLADVSDAIAIHPYGFTSPPEAAPGFDALNFRRAELLHDIMLRYGDADKPVYITETGWNDHPRWASAVTPSLRIAYTLDALDYTQREWPWLQSLCLWVMRFPAPTNSYPDGFTLVTPDFQPKPIYDAVQAYARGWSPGGALWLSPPG
ncbi:MAG: beta-galactosidase [Anaerolineae bacterium]|nr:beta-galactosidase [Anaerolineae bacterium]